ncbi:MAG: hypothetical protein AB8G16_19710 [Gammaproteobacteria bacterium]
MPIEILMTVAIALSVVFTALIGGDIWKKAGPSRGQQFFPPAVHVLAFIVATAAGALAVLLRLVPMTWAGAIIFLAIVAVPVFCIYVAAIFVILRFGR